MLSWPLLRENNETFHEAFVLVAWDKQMHTWECSVADVESFSLRITANTHQQMPSNHTVE
jgi:hypothetical protein